MVAIVELVNLNQLLELLFLLLHKAILYPRRSRDQLAKVQKDVFVLTFHIRCFCPDFPYFKYILNKTFTCFS